MASRIVSIGILAAAMLTGCSKSEPPAPKPQAAAPIQAAPKSEALQPAAGIDPALKERLARQEAAAQMFERKVLEPTPPKATESKTPEAKAPRAVEAKKAAEPAKPAPEPAAEPPKVAAAAPAKVSTPSPAPAKTEAPRTDVAAAKPSAAPAPAAARLVSRVDPEFPREAVQAGVEKGSVKARMTLDEAGAVTRVEVVEANPRRVFDRSVIRALSQWKFNEGAAGRSVEMEIDFKR